MKDHHKQISDQAAKVAYIAGTLSSIQKALHRVGMSTLATEISAYVAHLDGAAKAINDAAHAWVREDVRASQQSSENLYKVALAAVSKKEKDLDNADTQRKAG